MAVVQEGVLKSEVNSVEHKVRKCIRHLSKKQYELELPANAGPLALAVLKITKSSGGVSKAGAHLIQINVMGWQRYNFLQGRQKYWEEYKAFEKHPHIGTVPVRSIEDMLWCCVAHEVSHHVQFRYARKLHRFRLDGSKPYRKPHGQCFQDIYTYLRRDLVNPMIKG